MEILNQTQVVEKQNQSIWNLSLNSLSAYNFAKLTQLKAYNSIYQQDFIRLSDTYLNSATSKNLLEIEGYNLVQADHLNNVKRGGVPLIYLFIYLLILYS